MNTLAHVPGSTTNGMDLIMWASASACNNAEASAEKETVLSSVKHAPLLMPAHTLTIGMTSPDGVVLSHKTCLTMDSLYT